MNMNIKNIVVYMCPSSRAHLPFPHCDFPSTPSPCLCPATLSLHHCPYPYRRLYAPPPPHFLLPLCICLPALVTLFLSYTVIQFPLRQASFPYTYFLPLAGRCPCFSVISVLPLLCPLPLSLVAPVIRFPCPSLTSPSIFEAMIPAEHILKKQAAFCVLLMAHAEA